MFLSISKAGRVSIAANMPPNGKKKNNNQAKALQLDLQRTKTELETAKKETENLKAELNVSINFYNLACKVLKVTGIASLV